MTLDEYLTKQNLSAAAFAVKIGRATSTVTRLRNKDSVPDPETARAIYDATGGHVTASDFYGTVGPTSGDTPPQSEAAQ